MTPCLPKIATRVLLALAAFSLPAAASTPAAANPEPASANARAERERLTVTVVEAGARRATVLDKAALAALPQHEFTTRTPWHKGAVRFSGPRLRDVLAAAGVRPGGPARSIHAAALNDYEIIIPLQDAWDHDVIVATRLDGKEMTVANRGPFFVIYPFDQKPQLGSETFYSRSIWQLARMEVR